MFELVIIGLSFVVAVLGYYIYRQRMTLVTLRRKIVSECNLSAQLNATIASHKTEVAQTNAFLATISSVTHDAVFVLDQNHTVIAANNNARLLFDNQNPIGEDLTQIIDSPELHELLEHASREDQGLEEQLILKGRNYRIRTKSISYEDEQQFIGVALEDITQLVRLNRSRRDMVANISHELGTPIANIRLIIDSVFHDRDKPKRKDSISSLRAIAQETDTLQKLAQELLDLSMIESGQAIMKLVELPLIEVADEAIARVEDQLEAKQLQIARHIPENLRVLCDRDQTRRVLLNLIHNAIKWSPEGEVITIQAIDTVETITVSVLDMGPGVPDDQTARIFERFYQVDSSRSEKGKGGTGLGLALCKHIIESHGGKIWAEGNSRIPGGRFIFTLLNPLYDDREFDDAEDRAEEFA